MDRDAIERIRSIARQKGVLRPRDLEAVGISRHYLYQMVAQGHLVRLARGLYAIPDRETSEHGTLAEVGALAPDVVVCLISALQFHGLTSQLSPAVQIAIEGTSWKPVIDYPPIEVFRFSGDAYTLGIETHTIDRMPVKVYSPAKTVADLFKYRNKLGLDVALEALRAVRTDRRSTAEELWKALQACRVDNVARPYLEALSWAPPIPFLTGSRR